ncbi:MAG: 4'-phosphopantetheinyl transferase superfamily protein [Syntrophaceae bacterium]
MIRQIMWDTPPTDLLLSGKNVHIWLAVLDLPGKSVEELKRSLSEDEMMRADRFRYEHDRNRFISARGILRLILSGYLSVEPDTISFVYEKDGKPRLQNASGRADIQFNLSHSEGLALYVFTRGKEAGIDLERIRDFPEMELIVEQFFSVRERALFGTLQSSEKKKTFFNWWTRKEASMKANGKGLSYSLDRIDFLPTDGKSTGSLKMLRDGGEQARWSIWDVRPAEEFAGAVVVEEGNWNVQYWQWSDENRDCWGKMQSNVQSLTTNIQAK